MHALEGTLRSEPEHRKVIAELAMIVGHIDEDGTVSLACEHALDQRVGDLGGIRYHRTDLFTHVPVASECVATQPPVLFNDPRVVRRIGCQALQKTRPRRSEGEQVHFQNGGPVAVLDGPRA